MAQYILIDPSHPVVNYSYFERIKWTSNEFVHSQGKEKIPANMPKPRGIGFMMRSKVDVKHAGDTITRRSRMGFLVYLNCAPIYWS